MPNTIYKKRLRVRKNVDSPWIDIPAIVSTPGGIDPVDKTSAMTQPVGRDADGKLWTAPGGGGGGTGDHTELTNRDAADQHPMSAITGLESALAGKQPAGNYLTSESDPTVHAWAKQPQKPSYTAGEVGAATADEFDSLADLVRDVSDPATGSIMRFEYPVGAVETNASVMKAGANLLVNHFGHAEEERTASGITFTNHTDGSVSVNGTATANFAFYISNAVDALPAGAYRLSGCPSGGGSTRYRLVCNYRLGGSDKPGANDDGGGANLTLPDGVESIKAYIYIPNGSTVTNLTFYPMLEFGSTGSAFAKAEVEEVPAGVIRTSGTTTLFRNDGTFTATAMTVYADTVVAGLNDRIDENAGDIADLKTDVDALEKLESAAPAFDPDAYAWKCIHHDNFSRDMSTPADASAHAWDMGTNSIDGSDNGYIPVTGSGTDDGFRVDHGLTCPLNSARSTAFSLRQIAAEHGGNVKIEMGLPAANNLVSFAYNVTDRRNFMWFTIKNNTTYYIVNLRGIVNDAFVNVWNANLYNMKAELFTAYVVRGWLYLYMDDQFAAAYRVGDVGTKLYLGSYKGSNLEWSFVNVFVPEQKAEWNPNYVFDGGDDTYPLISTSANEGGYTLQNTETRYGIGYADHFVLHRDDEPIHNGLRAERSVQSVAAFGRNLRDVTVEFDVMFPENSTDTEYSDLFFQMHDRQTGGVSRSGVPVYLAYRSNEIILKLSSTDAPDDGPDDVSTNYFAPISDVTQGEWHHIKVFMRERYEARQHPVTIVWLDGAKVMESHAANAYNDVVAPSPQYGIYKNPSVWTAGVTVFERYFDNFRMAYGGDYIDVTASIGDGDGSGDLSAYRTAAEQDRIDKAASTRIDGLEDRVYQQENVEYTIPAVTTEEIPTSVTLYGTEYEVPSNTRLAITRIAGKTAESAGNLVSATLTGVRLVNATHAQWLDFGGKQSLASALDVSDLIAVARNIDGTYDVVRTTRLASVDAGELNWAKASSVSDGFSVTMTSLGVKFTGAAAMAGVTGVKSNNGFALMADKTMCIGNTASSPILRIRNSDYSGYTADQLKADLSGKTLIYELETPITTTLASGLTESQIACLTAVGTTIGIIGNDNSGVADPDVTVALRLDVSRAVAVDAPARELINGGAAWEASTHASTTTGDIYTGSSYATWYCLIRYPVKPNHAYRTKSKVQVVYYNDNMTYISSLIAGDNDSNTGVKIEMDFVTPSNAAYMSINTKYPNEILFDIGGYTVDPDAPNPLKLQGKKILMFGDSITGNYPFGDNIAYYVEKLTGAKTYNVGFGGCRMELIDGISETTQITNPFAMAKLVDVLATSDTDPTKWAEQDAAAEQFIAEPRRNRLTLWRLDVLKGVDLSEIDIVTIAYGTNEIGYQQDNEENPLDPYTFGGATRYAIEQLLDLNPKLQIVLLTPIYRHDVSNTGQDSDEFVNASTGLGMADNIETLKAVGMEYKIPVIDMYHDLGINAINYTAYFGDGDEVDDGTHINSLGRERYGRRLAGELNRLL